MTTSFIDPFSGDQVSVSPTGYISINFGVDTILTWPINGSTGPAAANIIDAFPLGPGLSLIMPPANEVSTGQSLLLKNVGGDAFTVKDSAGGTILSIQPTSVWYLYVTDNSTVAGTWSTLQFGASTSVANAAALAGAGLAADGPELETSQPVTAVYSNTTLTDANRGQFLVWASGVGTITLPISSSVDNGWYVIIRNGGSGILTLTPQGSDHIDGNSSQQMQLNTSLVLVNTGSTWNSYGFGQPSTFVYTQLTKTVTGGTVTLTSSEAANVIQEYFGVLTSNCTVILPSTVQLYALSNQTTGAYTLTFKTAAVGATTVTLPQINTVLAISDGTNVYNASTATVGAITAITLGVGSSTAPALNFQGNTQTGLYVPNSHALGVTVEGNIVATFGDAAATVPGLTVPLGISGGTF